MLLLVDLISKISGEDARYEKLKKYSDAQYHLA
jgi:hypothetical protein